MPPGVSDTRPWNCWRKKTVPILNVYANPTPEYTGAHPGTTATAPNRRLFPPRQWPEFNRLRPLCVSPQVSKCKFLTNPCFHRPLVAPLGNIFGIRVHFASIRTEVHLTSLERVWRETTGSPNFGKAALSFASIRHLSGQSYRRGMNAATRWLPKAPGVVRPPGSGFVENDPIHSVLPGVGGTRPSHYLPIKPFPISRPRKSAHRIHRRPQTDGGNSSEPAVSSPAPCTRSSPAPATRRLAEGYQIQIPSNACFSADPFPRGSEEVPILLPHASSRHFRK